MPKKRATLRKPKEGVLIVAAKTIGRAAGKIAAVISGVTAAAVRGPANPSPKRRSTTARKTVKPRSAGVARTKKPAKRVAKTVRRRSSGRS